MDLVRGSINSFIVLNAGRYFWGAAYGSRTCFIAIVLVILHTWKQWSFITSTLMFWNIYFYSDHCALKLNVAVVRTCGLISVTVCYCRFYRFLCLSKLLLFPILMSLPAYVLLLQWHCFFGEDLLSNLVNCIFFVFQDLKISNGVSTTYEFLRLKMFFVISHFLNASSFFLQRQLWFYCFQNSALKMRLFGFLISRNWKYWHGSFCFFSGCSILFGV